jgi:hypothetical protein
LHQHRLIEAVVLAQLRVPGRIDTAFARHRLNGIAGDQADKHEHKQRNPDEGRNHEAQPGKDEPEHAVACHPPRKGKGKEKWAE